MRSQATYRGPEGQRFALEPPPYGVGWTEVAYEAQMIFVYVSEPGEPGHHFVQLLAYDADRNEVGRKSGWVGEMNRNWVMIIEARECSLLAQSLRNWRGGPQPRRSADA